MKHIPTLTDSVVRRWDPVSRTAPAPQHSWALQGARLAPLLPCDLDLGLGLGGASYLGLLIRVLAVMTPPCILYFCIL